MLSKNSNSNFLQVLKNKKIQHIAIELVSCALSAGGLDNFFMTTANVYMYMNELVINYTSIVGMAFVNEK